MEGGYTKAKYQVAWRPQNLPHLVNLPFIVLIVYNYIVGCVIFSLSIDSNIHKNRDLFGFFANHCRTEP